MGRELDLFFDVLKRDLDIIRIESDNEALRHDLLIRPILTSPLTLGWHGPELLPQQQLTVPKELSESYIWRGAVPKKSRPDLIIVPYGVNDPVAIIEEKRQHKTLEDLKANLSQLVEYQALHHTVWGVLTDGERWIIQRNFEVFHTYDSLDDLKAGIVDFHHCIGRTAILARLNSYGTPDIVIVRPAPSYIIIASVRQITPISRFDVFLKAQPEEGSLLMEQLTLELTESMLFVPETDGELGDHLIHNFFETVFHELEQRAGRANSLNGWIELLANSKELNLKSLRRCFKVMKLPSNRSQAITIATERRSRLAEQWLEIYNRTNPLVDKMPVVGGPSREGKNTILAAIPEILDLCRRDAWWA